MSRVPVRLAAGARAAEAPPGWAVLRPAACPCCVGRVATQVALTRLVREQKPRGVVIELADATHAPALRRALREWPLSESVELDGAASD